MKATPLLGLILSASFGCAPQGQAPPPNPSEVEAAARRFLDYAHAFDYAAMRAIATPDCEILLDGRRMDLDGFEAFLREMEKDLGGEKLGTYDLLDLNTEIVGDVAYTSWRSTNWLESAILIRSGGRWLIDRAFAMRIPHAEP